MNLPPISPAKSPVSFAEVDAPTLFKRGEPIHTPDPPHTFKHFDSEVQTVQPKYMTGYCGFQPHQDQEAPLPRVIAAPVVGYTGCYRGKNIGKLGRCEVHRTRLSTWEKDTVSGILGVPAAQDDWEYSHYTNSCENFSDKKFQESSSPALGSSTGYSSGFLSSVGSTPGGTGSASSSGGFANHEAASTSGSLAYSQSNASRPEHEETETDRILQHIQQCLQGRFKTATAARSALKGAFFALDRFHCGRVQRGEFYEVLNRMAGAALSEGHMMYLTCALSCAGRQSPQQLEGLNQQDSESLGDDLEYVNYGRFLNIIVPRSKGKNTLS